MNNTNKYFIVYSQTTITDSDIESCKRAAITRDCLYPTYRAGLEAAEVIPLTYDVMILSIDEC